MTTSLLRFGTSVIAVLSTVSLPICSSAEEAQVFKDWKACFRFMAGVPDLMLKPHDDVLFKLAAESSVEWFPLEDGGDRMVAVVRLDYMREDFGSIRGHKGIGNFYLFAPVANGLQFVGRMEGNRYSWGTMNGRARFFVGSTMSANTSYEIIHDWDGAVFRQTSRTLYRYDAAGNRTPVPEKDPVTTEPPRDRAPRAASMP